MIVTLVPQPLIFKSPVEHQSDFDLTVIWPFMIMVPKSALEAVSGFLLSSFAKKGIHCPQIATTTTKKQVRKCENGKLHHIEMLTNLTSTFKNSGSTASV